MLLRCGSPDSLILLSVVLLLMPLPPKVSADIRADALPEGVRRFHDDRVIFDLLAALRAQPVPLRHIGFVESASSFQGDAKALIFKEPNRLGHISEPVTKAIRRALSGARDFTFLFTLKQNSTNVGTLLSFTSAKNRRLLELQSAWRKEELRLHYVMSQAANMIHVEKLAYQLADNLWHQVALTISGSQIALLIDCQKIYDRVLYRPIKEDLFRRNADLWLGQRGRWSSYFEGEMQEAMIVIGQHGSLEQCPHMESLCPTCGQHKLVAQAVELLQSEMHKVKLQLKAAEQKLQQLSQCDCIIRCAYNGTYYEDGQTWDIGNCHQCSCNRGRVTCAPKPCPPVPCAFPVHMKGSCCPACLRSCDLHGVVGGSGAFEHGMNVTSLAEVDSGNNRICVHCQCKDGSLECFEPADHRTLCPLADCPPEQQRTNSFDCCPYCEDYDYCAKGHKCSPHADCVNLHNRYDCVCRPGFHGNGLRCVDTDECTSGEHKCSNGSVCANTQGSYRCQCQPGFSHDTPFTCRDTDECGENSHSCSQHAVCINSRGSHSCRCKTGYYGDGLNCLPVCQPQCINGGSCVRPGLCSCPTGFHGARCELDLDECALGLHRCHANSRCQNLPGSYHCVCLKGFTDSGRDNIFGTLCKDANECSGRRGKDFTCSRGTRCINTVGSYKCLCNSRGACDTGCTYKVSPHRRLRVSSGSSIRDLIDPCLICSCHSGYLNCTKMPCNCSNLANKLEAKCCPRCLHAAGVGVGGPAASCWDTVQKKSHPAGSRWMRDCEICYCLSDGETQCHPIKCPPISCPHPVTRPGTCCPACPHADPCRRRGEGAGQRLLGDEGGRRRPARLRDCVHAGSRLSDGTRWRLENLSCVACQCRDGHICCSHDDQCALAGGTATTVVAASAAAAAAAASTSASPLSSSSGTTAAAAVVAATTAATTTTEAATTTTEATTTATTAAKAEDSGGGSVFDADAESSSTSDRLGNDTAATEPAVGP